MYSTNVRFSDYIEIKTIEQEFPVVLFFSAVQCDSSFEFVDEILISGNPYKSYSTKL